jgi:hypothetical protein
MATSMFAETLERRTSANDATQNSSVDLIHPTVAFINETIQMNLTFTTHYQDKY